MSTSDEVDVREEPVARTATICVVGMGYVGLPLGVAFDEAGYETIGFDIDSDRVDAFRSGADPTDEVGDGTIADSDVTFTDDPAVIADADVILVTVPTPLDNVQNPRLEFVKKAARTIGAHMTPGSSVVLESTVYPGVTRDIVAPIIAEQSGLTYPGGFNVAYSPERLSPGNNGRKLEDAVKVVGADDEETREELAELYGSIVDAGVYEAPSIEVAEATKVLENVQRDLNIALMNEMSIICDHLDLDTHEVIEACSTKWNFHEYTPGLVGGHCIPVDPLYLAHGSKRAGFSPDLILQGRKINEYMPKHVTELTIKALSDSGKVLRDASLLVLGVAYKPNVGDLRTSEVKSVIHTLDEYGITSDVYDPLADDDQLEEELDVTPLADLSFDGYDGIVLATPHDEFDDLDFVGATGALADDPVFIDVYQSADRDALEAAGYRYRSL